QDVKRGEITPMEILENDGHRPIHARHYEKVAEFAQHALPRSPEDLVLESGPIRLLTEGGHLQQPGRGAGPNCFQHGRATRSPAARLQGIDQRVEGFISAKTLGAVSIQRLRAESGQPLDRHLDEGGLADTRLARDEDQLSFAREHALRHGVQGCQWCGAPNPPTYCSPLLDRSLLRAPRVDPPGLGCCECRRLRVRGPLQPHPIDTDRPGNVLELVLAYILKGNAEPVEGAVHVFLHAIRHADPTNVRQGLQARCDIYPIAMDARSLD